MLIPVVLSGGSGTRLWPLSRELYPKQLLSLVGKGDSGIGDLSTHYKRYVAEAMDAKFARSGHDKTQTQRRRAR